jgi:hypothetical protein
MNDVLKHLLAVSGSRAVPEAAFLFLCGGAKAKSHKRFKRSPDLRGTGVFLRQGVA